MSCTHNPSDPNLGVREVLKLEHLMRNASQTPPPTDPSQPTDPAAPAVDEARVREVIENIRDYVQADGGDIELVRIEGFTVFVRVFGACVSCGSLDMTMTHGVQTMLQDEVDPLIQVEQVL